MFRREAGVAFALLVIWMAAQTGWSQESRGTVLGRVTDSSGLVVPDAAVQIANLATGVTVKGSANGEGNYFFPFLIPGTYQIAAEKTGFKRFVRDGIEVHVNDRLEVNISLVLGTVSDTITVNEEAPLLDTTSASVGRVVGFKEVRELPMNHGDPDNLIRLSGGVAFTDSPSKDQPWQMLNTAYAMAGQKSSTNEFTLDGASNTLHDVARGSVAEAWTPTGDSVAEFKVQTATFDASTGQTQGAVVNVSLKSGTNKFHGTLYWAKQLPNFNANLFFANSAGQPIGNFHYNRLGGTFSGPVTIPKLYNGKNRTFFMVAYEYIKSTTIIGTVATVPTVAQRNGDLSALLKLGANYQIYDPFSRVPAANGRFSNSPLAGNIIPANLVSPIAKNILTYYPLPDATGGTSDFGNNLNRSQWPSRIPYNSQLYKFDQVVSDKNRFMFRMNQNYHDSNDTDYFGFTNPALGAFFWTEAAGFAADDVHSFSSTLVMDIRLSDTRFVRAQKPEVAGQNFFLSTLGFPAAIDNQIGPGFHQFPAITMNGYTSLGSRTPLFKQTQTQDLTVSFDKIKGAHDFKFGFEYRRYPDNQTSGSSSTGLLLGFTEAYTQGPLDNAAPSPRGQALASLLYGLPSSGTLTLPAASNLADVSSVWGGYLQDNWKVTRKLTLNLGLRYEVEGPMTERFNRAVFGFDPNAALPFAAQVQANYAQNPTPEIPASQFLPHGGLTFAGVGGNPRGLYARDTNNFMPRIGFAYSANSKTVLRGGYGIYFGSLGTRLEDAIQTGFIQNTTVIPTLDGGQTFAANLANPFPNGFLPPLGSAAGTLTNVGNAISFNPYHPSAARLQKFQFDIERELPGQIVFDLGYMGARDGDLEIARNLSALPDQYLSTSPARDPATINFLTTNLPNPFNIPQFAGTGRAGSVIARSALLSPYPQFTGVSAFVYDGKAWYNALNVRIEKRFSHGFMFQANYTFSKFIEATSFLNGGDAAPTRAISNQDFPHHVSVSGIYEFPFGRGRHFLSNAHSVAGLLVSGWQLAPVYTYQSGPAIGFGNSIVTCPLSQIPISGKNNDKVSQWFNTSCFNRVSSQQLANNLITLSPRFGGIRSDSYNYWDVSLLKDTRIHEKLAVEFRVEALNVLNQVTFAAPNTSPTSTSFGQVTAQMNVPRRMQFTLRLQF
jgi:Carboxypeptidase regulatory-like domain/TonB dependent receptor